MAAHPFRNESHFHAHPLPLPSPWRLIALPALAQGDLTVNGQKIPASAVEEVVKQAKAQEPGRHP